MKRETDLLHKGSRHYGEKGRTEVVEVVEVVVEIAVEVEVDVVVEEVVAIVKGGGEEKKRRKRRRKKKKKKKKMMVMMVMMMMMIMIPRASPWVSKSYWNGPDKAYRNNEVLFSSSLVIV